MFCIGSSSLSLSGDDKQDAKKNWISPDKLDGKLSYKKSSKLP